MNTYLFKFNVVPTDNSWWTTFRNESETIAAENVSDAKELYFDILSQKYGFEVSKSARKTADKMFVDTPNGSKQIGFVYKAKTQIDVNCKWVNKYADIWTSIYQLTNIFENN